jgi:ribonuclease VapC
MIVVDTSALVAIFAEEAGHEACRNRLLSSDVALLPVAAYVEFTLIRRLRGGTRAWLDDIITRGIIKLNALELVHAILAADAADRYGKGSGHPAQLNFGDCLVYAVAKYRDLPLLFIGNDFALTDLKAALPA